MDIIELEKWVPSKVDPNRLEYAGQPIAEEVFQELKYRLESTGYLPDEYFVMDRYWENGREIPKNLSLFCITDYDCCEGVCLDVYLRWYEDGKPVTKTFITGKTLGEDGNDLDRMYLISSAITKAFNGYGYSTNRSRFLNNKDAGGSVIHLSAAEEKTILNALLEQHERQAESMSQTEQLLRRMTGSITAYIDLMGQRPLHLSEYDRAVLAIRDGDLDAFKSLLENIPGQADRDGLLIEAAGRPGAIGRKMTMLLLAEQTIFSTDSYGTACRKAIEINDIEKTAFLVEQAAGHTNGLPLEFYGDLACEAYHSHRGIAMEIVKMCTPDQVAAMPDKLFSAAVKEGDIRFDEQMVQKGYEMTSGLSQTILHINDRNELAIRIMLGAGIRFEPEDYASLNACIQRGYTLLGIRMLDLGMDFDVFRELVQEKKELTETDTFKELARYWEDNHSMEPELRQSM